MKNIQLENTNITIPDLCHQKKDLYKINEFYNNYTTVNSKRNYKIICVKYELIFKKQNKLSKLLGIGPLNLEKIETKRNYPVKIKKKLELIYKNLNLKMKKNKFIKIV